MLIKPRSQRVVILVIIVGLWLATLTVRFRDLRYMISYALQGWMYATPVVYSAALIPEQWQLVYKLNPMFWVVEGFRWSILGKGTPPEPLMAVSVGLVVLMLASGAYVFRRTERTVVDLL